MGQIFSACAYDIEKRTRCVIDADKFHANCYSYNDTVLSMHYLLRQQPYRIMWGGQYIMLDDNLERYSSEEYLLGISAYLDEEIIENFDEKYNEKSYYDKAKFINDNYKKWKNISVHEEAAEYFDWENTHSVKYSGYLVNHTKKLAIDLADYYKKSKYIMDTENGFVEIAIDLIPVLTETGDGTQMALYEGISADTTEELARQWCGDLLQITDNIPENYQLINCCFAEIWDRAKYCYANFGTNENNYLLNDAEGNIYSVAAINISGKRGTIKQLKAEKIDNRVKFFTA